MALGEQVQRVAQVKARDRAARSLERAIAAAREHEGRAVHALLQARRDDADHAVGIAERQQVLAEQADADRRTVGLGHFGYKNRRLPIATEKLTRRRLRADPHQAFILFSREHRLSSSFP